MTENGFAALIFIYCAIAVACAVALVVRWIERTKNDAVIWPITGVLWPALALIGLWKVWKGERHD